MDVSTEAEILIGITEIAVALAGFSGVVVVFGSRSDGRWHPGDRLRLRFLLESSLTAGALALLAVFALSLAIDRSQAWAAASGLWAAAMTFSLVSSSRAIRAAREEHSDVDDASNSIMVVAFVGAIAVEIANVLIWREFAPFMGGLLLNLLGACAQFGRLIRSAFRE